MSGPGTELGKLIPDWLAKQTKGCGCSDWRRRMDKLGVEGCKANRNMIVMRLVRQKGLLPPPLRILPKLALRAGAEMLVDRAIKNAELSASTESP